MNDSLKIRAIRAALLFVVTARSAAGEAARH